MKIYVAGASAEIERARRVIAELRARGIEVPGDWPAIVDAHNGRTNHGLTDDERRSAARACMRAAVDCDVFLLLVPHAQTIGAWVELGAALESDRRCIASGLEENCARSIFVALCHPVITRQPCGYVGRPTPGEIGAAHCEADDMAISWIAGFASARADDGTPSLTSWRSEVTT